MNLLNFEGLKGLFNVLLVLKGIYSEATYLCVLAYKISSFYQKLKVPPTAKKYS